MDQAEASFHSPSRSRRGLAFAMGAVAVLLAVIGVTAAVAARWDAEALVFSFVASNAIIGTAFGLCGAVIAWHVPRHPTGWLFGGGGLAYALSAAAAPLALATRDTEWLARTLATIYLMSWPWAIALLLPLGLALTPTGMFERRWMRALAWLFVVTSPLFVLQYSAEPSADNSFDANGWLSIPQYDELAWLWNATELRSAAFFLFVLALLVYRLVKGSRAVRRQLAWVVGGTASAVVAMALWAFASGAPIWLLFIIPLIPASVMVAIVWAGLFDTKLVASRVATWAILTGLVTMGYAALSGVASALLDSNLGGDAVLTVVLIVAGAALLPRLQAMVDRVIYGQRRDPAALIGHIGAEIAAPTGGLAGVVESLRSALRLPYLALEGEGIATVESGSPGTATVAVPLLYEGDEVGQLRFGLRPGELRLSRADHRAVRLLAVPLAATVRATRARNDLEAAREHLVQAREEERRRLRRDLHDGLGPALTGLALTADAAANQPGNPERTAELLSAIRLETRTALQDVRRVIEDLRPPALDELGLVGALRQRADQARTRTDARSFSVEISAPPDLPQFDAAVELAAYRIAVEALTNVMRHASASSALVSIEADTTALTITIADDGTQPGPWEAGVGLSSMAERVAQLGGTFEAGPTNEGGLVRAVLPHLQSLGRSEK